MTILVTGSAGFIGNHVALALLEAGERVVGVDSLTPYYDVRLKEARLARLVPFERFTEARVDLADHGAVAALFAAHQPDRVIHLAAQAGVRYSLEAPRSYVDSNITGFLNILEGCRAGGVGHLVYASSSSVYGGNTRVPFSEHQAADHPISLYAATKKANEMMAHAYSHLFSIPATGLRFFTVYGPWGRPDMALFKFTEAILAGRPIDVYNNGEMKRNFTYIDDITAGIVAILDRPPAVDSEWSSAAPDPATSGIAPYRVYNIGNNDPVPLMRFIEALERALGRTAEKNFMALQPGDVPETSADGSDFAAVIGAAPGTPIETGIARFVEWYRAYHELSGAGGEGVEQDND